ncbi:MULTISPECIES: Fur family transcriptional regulator [Anaerolinea]|jgi:Fur family peroxide stress response transcriptional regulator|uniref:Fur family transcriptional regulator n=1 Tax=Anaerolinea TaxID=233189 RepID=UPI00263049C0|nr:Fur family transcriptional regulator [Anaerolinea thermophila]
MRDPEQRFQELMAKLRARAYRLTPQRVALIRLLAYSEGHPDAAELYRRLLDQFPTTSLATVYKTLNLLKEMGEVLEIEINGIGGEGSRFDGNDPAPHPHLICVRCHRIMDGQVSLTEEILQTVQGQSGYRVISHRLDFYGICPECQVQGVN